MLLALEVQARKVAVPCVTPHPAGAWTAQQERSLLTDPGERAGWFKFLVRDRDSKFTAAFDGITSGNGARVINAPARSPLTSSDVERFAGALRRECLDHVPVLGKQLPAGSLAEFAWHCDEALSAPGPAAGTSQRRPSVAAGMPARIECRRVLRGLISRDSRAA